MNRYYNELIDTFCKQVRHYNYVESNNYCGRFNVDSYVNMCCSFVKTFDLLLVNVIEMPNTATKLMWFVFQPFMENIDY